MGVEPEEGWIKEQGGPEALARIREAEESDAAKLELTESNITDLTPLAGLTKLEELFHRLGFRTRRLRLQLA